MSEFFRCRKCDGYMTPEYVEEKLIKLKGKPPLCAKCALRGLASFFEEEIGDETIKEKSENEQLGAWIRDLAK